MSFFKKQGFGISIFCWTFVAFIAFTFVLLGGYDTKVKAVYSPTYFSIHKIDETGAPLKGSSFRVSEIGYTIRNISSVGRYSYVTSDGIYIIPFLVPFSLDSEEIYAVMIQVGDTISMKDGQKINVQQYLVNHDISTPTFRQYFICKIVEDETETPCSLSIIENDFPSPDPDTPPIEVPEIINWHNTIKNVYLVPIDVIGEQIYKITPENVDEIFAKATLLSKDQYEISDKGILKDKNSIKITLPVAEFENADSVIEFHDYPTILSMKSIIRRKYGINEDYFGHAGDIIIEEIKAPEGYNLATPNQQRSNIYNAYEVKFINTKKSEGAPTEDPANNSGIAVPNTGDSTGNTNATLTGLSLIVPILGVLLLTLATKLNYKKVDFSNEK